MSRLPMPCDRGTTRGPNLIRRQNRVAAMAGVGLLTCVVTVISLAAQSEPTVEHLLTERLGFSADDLQALDGGAAIISSLDTRVRQELAHVGAVYVDVPPAEFVERFRDIEQFESGPGIPHIGRFDSPPRLEDLQGLTLPEEDLEALPSCRPGDCDLKLSADAMGRFRNEVDWSSASAPREANRIAREMILELVLAYQADGNGALGSYVDNDEPMPVAEEFRALLASRDPLPAPVPALLAYLDEFPHGSPPGAENFFYWTIVDFGLKPTIRVNHVTIYPLEEGPPSVEPLEHVPPPAERPEVGPPPAARLGVGPPPGARLGVGPPPGEAYAIAIKQLYASHYFHTTLELRFLTGHVHRSGRHGASLISITRSRNDGMTGFKGWFLRPIIRRRSRDAVRGYLEHVRRQVEQPAPAGL